MERTEDGRPIDGRFYVDQAFDLTGLDIRGVTFERCVLTIRPGTKTRIRSCNIQKCYLDGGGWPPSVYDPDDVVTVSEWARRQCEGSA